MGLSASDGLVRGDDEVHPDVVDGVAEARQPPVAGEPSSTSRRSRSRICSVVARTVSGGTGEPGPAGAAPSSTSSGCSRRRNGGRASWSGSTAAPNAISRSSWTALSVSHPLRRPSARVIPPQRKQERFFGGSVPTLCRHSASDRSRPAVLHADCKRSDIDNAQRVT